MEANLVNNLCYVGHTTFIQLVPFHLIHTLFITYTHRDSILCLCFIITCQSNLSVTYIKQNTQPASDDDAHNMFINEHKFKIKGMNGEVGTEFSFQSLL